jgi:hypothetical protein
VRSQDSLPLEADLLRDALGGEVLDVGQQVKPLEVELVEGSGRAAAARALRCLGRGRRGRTSSRYGHVVLA